MAEAVRPQLFTVPLGFGLTDQLASYLLQGDRGKDSLADSLILLPNNRAIKTLTDSFVRLAQRGLLLPRMVAVGDLALDEKLGVLMDPIGGTPMEQIAPAINPIEQRIVLAQQIQKRRPSISIVEALKLADTLAAAFDTLEIEEIGLERVRAVDLSDELQAHWQSAYSDFVAIAAEFKSQLLRRQQLTAAARRNLLLRRFALTLPNDVPVIAAGITTAAPAIADLLKAVIRLPKAMLVLPHLDLVMHDDEWNALGPVVRDGQSDLVEETHPQFHLKLLLEKIAVRREEVTVFPGCKTNPMFKSVDRVFARAEQVMHWAELPPTEKRLPQARIMTADDSAQEALAIALLIRQSLEVPGKQIALVTPDRELSLRASAQLKRWGVDVDDSAGQPLIQLLPATLLLGLAEIAADQISPVSLLTVLKHPLVRAGEDRLLWLDKVRALDLCLRGPRLGIGLEAIDEAINLADLPADAKSELSAWWQEIAQSFAELQRADATNLPVFLDMLVATATSLTDGKVWHGHAGRQLSTLLQHYRSTDLVALGAIQRNALPALLRRMLDSEVSRPVYGSHPRVAIYGLLEARLQQADLVICAGLNEGTWPQMPHPDPWLSPQLRRKLGLPGVERNIGLSAHDLMSLLGGKDVVLSRAVRDRSGPTIASRFLLRIQALVGRQLREEHEAINWAKAFDEGQAVKYAKRPKPMPSPEQRRIPISVTQIETLRADPYAFYANKILGLKALPSVGGQPDAAWRGVVVHRVLEQWAKSDNYIPDKLAARAGALLANPAFHPALRVLWQPRVTAALNWIAETSVEMRTAGRKIAATECWGTLNLSGVEVKGQADRIDRDSDGGLVIVDYKSGEPPSPKSVKAGYRIQLGLLGAMAEAGTMKGVEGVSKDFEYWSLGKNKQRGFGYIKRPVSNKNGAIVDIIPDALRFARDAVETWIIGNAPFTAKLNPEYSYQDYDQLMRLNEWYGREDDSDGE